MLPISAPSPRTGIIDCFAGVGGFSHALSDPRFGLALALALTVELDASARHVYAAAFPTHDPARIISNIRQLTHVDGLGQPATAEALAAWEKDGMPSGVFVEASCEQTRSALRELGVDPSSVAWVTAGAPCTTFSKSGAQEGVRDRVRGTLFGDVALIVDAVRPDFVLLENVPNLVSARHRDWLDTVLARLRASGYAVGSDPLILSPDRLAPEFGGTAQSRRRLFFPARRLDVPGLTADDPRLFEPVSLDALADAFSWDPARWDPLEILDPDESFDTTAYLLAPRERVWVTAWNDLVQSLTCDDLPPELYVDSFTPGFAPSPGTHPAAAARMRRSHAFYLDNRQPIDEWLARSWELDGALISPRDFPTTRRILEWQARSAQPSAADRDIWQCTFSFRSSGIRVKPLTTLPALVALNTTSAVGPRGRFITPREAARLQGFPTAVFEPPLERADAPRLAHPPLEQCPPLVNTPVVAPTRTLLLEAAAEQVAAAWWARGGYCDTATQIAVAAAGPAGVSPGEVLVAAAALAASQPQWRGSGLRWSDLAWDAYRMLSPGSPIAYDASFAAVDWRVRRRLTLSAACAAGCDLLPSGEDAVLEWFSARAGVALPAAGHSWRDRARDIAVAARFFGLDVMWLRALHRCALLGHSDRVMFPLSGLAELDAHLADFEVLVMVEDAHADPACMPAALEAYMAAQQLSADAVGHPGACLLSRNTGAGMPASSLPLTALTLSQGRARLAQLDGVIASSRERLERLDCLGLDDPRARSALTEAMNEFTVAAFDVRRHGSMRGQLMRAAEFASTLHHFAPQLGLDEDALQDVAFALVDAWAVHMCAPPLGPLSSLVLPFVPGDAVDAPSWLGQVDGSGGDQSGRLPGLLAHLDGLVSVLCDEVGVAGAVVAAHVERERSRLAHVLALVDAGVLSGEDANELVFALTRRPSVGALVEDVSLAAGFLLHHHSRGPVSWDTVVDDFAPATGRDLPVRLSPGSRPKLSSAVLEGAS